MGKKNKNNKKYKGYHPEMAFGVIVAGDREIKCSAIYNYLVSLTDKEIVKYVNDRVKEGHHYPSIQQVTRGLVLSKYFPQLLAPLNVSSTIQRDMETINEELVPGLIYRMRIEARDGARCAQSYFAAYTTAIPKYIASCKLIRHSDGILYHICDYRVVEDEYTRELFRMILDDDNFFNEFSPIVCEGLLQLLKKYGNGDIEHDDYVRIADWYLKDLRLESSFDGAHGFLKAMSGMTEIDTLQELALEFYEEHSSSMDRMMKRFPQYDYVNRGKCDVYASISDYVKKNGEKEEDFFIEEADGKANPASHAGKRAANKAKRAEYRLKVIEAMDILFKEVQKISSDFRVLNFTPNELKTKKAHSDYIAIAFKHGDHWYILVDSLRLGEGAIFLWKGEYSKGLEVLKQARSFARETPGITHKNHYHSIENIVKYRAIIQEAL